jgi:hypothetical protein
MTAERLETREGDANARTKKAEKKSIINIDIIVIVIN